MGKLDTLDDLIKLVSKHIHVITSKDVVTFKVEEPLKDISIELLREEAIKWIKELKDFQKVESIEFGMRDGKCEWRINGKICDDADLIEKYSLLNSYNLEVTKWIKYFFNIKKEDLK